MSSSSSKSKQQQEMEDAMETPESTAGQVEAAIQFGGQAQERLADQDFFNKFDDDCDDEKF
ncbi:hypothetical protein BCR33DRAFT_712483 [Rhizoclosmatium globosum]|uniref:Uncharacterized protein n=1 Tax=Rhizoclosmatium globosum TaxID=329046 RepID=A0A1Y2CYL1_9FUNG|nr:hypothetical protein BCR33DRAFT_712483 [Rhizoclosmatium globosum]|eukprot:ORY51425.1 hypothetical protein BCR33DRAFT_712483 [Rhizoclosmatium globosum]